MPSAKVGIEYMVIDAVRMNVSNLVPLSQPAMAPKITPRLIAMIKAVPTSHGMNDAFSTGSQNHQPPQPSS